MKRTAVVLSLMVVAAAMSVVTASAQISPLMNGVYSVTVKGTTTDFDMLYNPSTSFSLPGILVVFTSPSPLRPFEMCLFVHNPPNQAPVDGPIGGAWLATWLGCGQALGHGGGWFSAPYDDSSFKGEVTQSTVNPNALIAFPPAEFYDQQASFLVFENMFMAPHSTTPQIASGGWWFASTADDGNTVFGRVELKGYKSGLLAGLEVAKYSATFTGNLLFRLE
jgi:hypothetical protein